MHSSWDSQNSWYVEENNTLNQSYSNICDSVTDHWLYFIFTGYLLPFISPRVRSFIKEFTNSLKNSDIGGNIVTLTEYGFYKIQLIENNDEMKDFIKRLCKSKKIELNDESVEKIAWMFSGDNDETHESIQQTWKKLNNILQNGKYP